MEPPTWKNLAKTATRYRTALLIVASVILAAIIVGFHSWFDRHEGTAAWVQAFGAIIVIASTAWIANENFSQERARTREAELRLWESVAMLSGGCLACLDAVLRDVHVGPYLNESFLKHYSPTDFAAPMEGLEAIPLHQLGRSDLISAVIHLRRVMGRAKTLLDDFRKYAITQGTILNLDLSTLRNQRVEVFNAHASITRIVHGWEAEEELSRLASNP